MSLEDNTESLARMLRDFQAAVKAHLARDDGPGNDPIDRVLAAAMVAISAAMLAWPTGRKLPRYAAVTLSVGRKAWAKRALWMPKS